MKCRHHVPYFAPSESGYLEYLTTSFTSQNQDIVGCKTLLDDEHFIKANLPYIRLFALLSTKHDASNLVF